MFDIPPELLGEDGIYQKELKIAVELALKAGANIEEHCKKVGTKAGQQSETTLQISTKQNDADFATAIDILNEKIITEGLLSHFPHHQIIGEESTGTGSLPELTSDPTWIIDPIDGTTNFASGLPLTCVSIGFCQNQIPVMGIVYAPMTQELFLGVKNKGSFRNGIPICLSPSTLAKTLKDSIVLFEFGYARSEESIDKMLNAVKRILQHGCRTTRCLGSGVLDLCYVAMGRLDVIYTGVSEEGWKPWDYCAGMVIVQEAGGCIRSLQNENDEFDDCGKVVPGSSFDIYSKSMICAVHPGLLEECRNTVLGFK